MRLRVCAALDCSPIEHLILDVEFLHLAANGILLLLENPAESALLCVFDVFLGDHDCLSIWVFFVLLVFVHWFLLLGEHLFFAVLSVFLMLGLDHVLLKEFLLHHHFLLLELLYFLTHLAQ